MAEFNERTIRGPGGLIDTIRPGENRPWMVWTAAGVIAALALYGLVSGIRGGHPAAGVALALTQGEALNPATAAAATPAVGLPKDQQWSTLSGPEVLSTASAAPAKSAAADNSSDDDDSDAPAATAAADEPDQGQDTAAPLSATPPPTATPAPRPAPSAPVDNSTPF